MGDYAIELRKRIINARAARMKIVLAELLSPAHLKSGNARTSYRPLASLTSTASEGSFSTISSSDSPSISWGKTIQSNPTSRTK